MSEITSIDAAWGINIQPAGETERSLARLSKSYIYGETEALDCPEDHDCWCEDKEGFMGFSGRHKSKKFHIDSASPLPMIKVKSYGTWAADTRMEKIEFNNFSRNKTECGA